MILTCSLLQCQYINVILLLTYSLLQSQYKNVPMLLTYSLLQCQYIYVLMFTDLQHATVSEKRHYVIDL